jgi:hypothetical protein
MSFSSYLTQSGTITREVPSGTDRYNNAETLPRVIATAVRCRKTQKTMRMLNAETAEYGYVHADLILFLPGENVLPQDTVMIGSQSWRVTQILKRMRANDQHHISCMVEAING